MPETIVVMEPDLISFDCWLASNPDEEEVRRWLRSIEAYFNRKDQVKREEDGKA